MGVEKEPKPKKAFEIKVTIWEDGEIDSEMIEYRQNSSGRGAPGKWRVTATDFVRRIEETLGDPDILLGNVYDMIGGLAAGCDSTKQVIADALAVVKQVPPGSTTPEEPENSVESPKVEEKEEKPKKKKKGAAASSDDSDGMDFGGFDTDKEQKGE